MVHVANIHRPPPLSSLTAYQHYPPPVGVAAFRHCAAKACLTVAGGGPPHPADLSHAPVGTYRKVSNAAKTAAPAAPLSPPAWAAMTSPVAATSASAMASTEVSCAAASPPAAIPADAAATHPPSPPPPALPGLPPPPTPPPPTPPPGWARMAPHVNATPRRGAPQRAARGSQPQATVASVAAAARRGGVATRLESARGRECVCSKEAERVWTEVGEKRGRGGGGRGVKDWQCAGGGWVAGGSEKVEEDGGCADGSGWRRGVVTPRGVQLCADHSRAPVTQLCPGEKPRG